MSHTIEFDRVAVRVPDDREWTYENWLYLLITEVGDSNVLDHDDTIVRRWQYYTIGSQPDVMHELAHAARGIERGDYRYQNGTTKIENYLSNWRDAMTGEDILTIDEFTSEFYTAELQVHHPSNDVELQESPPYGDGGPKDAFKEIQSSWRRTNPDDTDRPVYHCDISEDSLQVFASVADDLRVTIDF